jgi:excisionase family DNA binding protein
METDHLLTFAAVAKRLGVSQHTVKKWVDAGAIKASRPAPGASRRILQSELDAFYSRLKSANSELSESAD